MSLFEDTDSRSLKGLFAEVHSRATLLHDFQRDLVWEPGATQELIASIANNYSECMAPISNHFRDRVTALATLGGVA